MIELFGSTRNVVKKSYALLTPEGFVSSFLPGWQNGTCVVLISPAMGARFSQYLITLNSDGEGRVNTGKTEWFIYVLNGTGVLTTTRNEKYKMDTGNFIFLPPDKQFHLKSGGIETRILIFQKEFQPLENTSPNIVYGHQSDVPGKPFLGNDDARLQVLLPDRPEFDMAVNIFTYQPGATLPFVETHIMEHGLVMLSGQGVYRLDSDWHPVKEGDVIWMAPYCPQWFVAMGKTSASYIYYKDVNRLPM